MKIAAREQSTVRSFGTYEEEEQDEEDESDNKETVELKPSVVLEHLTTRQLKSLRQFGGGGTDWKKSESVEVRAYNQLASKTCIDGKAYEKFLVECGYLGPRDKMYLPEHQGGPVSMLDFVSKLERLNYSGEISWNRVDQMLRHHKRPEALAPSIMRQSLISMTTFKSFKRSKIVGNGICHCLNSCRLYLQHLGNSLHRWKYEDNGSSFDMARRTVLAVHIWMMCCFG